MQKRCGKCERNLHLDSFYNKKTARDGKYTVCKECDDAIRKLRFQGLTPIELKNQGYIDRINRTTPPDIIINGDIATIYLTASQDIYTTIDAEDAPKVAGKYWSLSHGYVVLANRRHRLHRILMNAGPDDIIDHIDGDPLNNRKSNLRFVTVGENRSNARKLTGASKYKGVFYRTDRGTWRAQLVHNGERYTAYFDSEIEAAKHYDTLAREHFGEYGTYNFPLPGERSAI